MDFFGQKRNRIQPHALQYTVHHTGLVAEQLIDDTPIITQEMKWGM